LTEKRSTGLDLASMKLSWLEKYLDPSLEDSGG
jgi:hypothetical protein